MRRALVVLVVLVIGAGVAQAKMPGFVVEVMPESPVAGQPFEILVRLEESMPVMVFTSLLGLYRADDPDRVQKLPVFRSGKGTYSRTVTIDEPGEWVIIAFPDRTGWSVEEVPPGYPDRIPITVRADPTPLRLTGGAVVLLILGWFAVRSIATAIET